MSDTCNCCRTCEEFNGLINVDHSFAKKLLVAISIVVLLSMCVMPAQARSLAEHKKRHKQARAVETKELMKMPNLNERDTNARIQLAAHGKRKKNPYREATISIFKQIKHSFRCFNGIRSNLSDYSIFNRGKPDWLPRTNYKVVHFKKYTNAHDNSEQKFKFVMPRLYRSLKMYELVFEALLGAEMQPMDARSDLYKEARQEFLKSTVISIKTITWEIEYYSNIFKLPVPVVNKSSIKLDSLLDVPYPQNLIRNDYIALRGYGKTINNWYCELHPGKPSRKTCVRYVKRLKNLQPAKKLG